MFLPVDYDAQPSLEAAYLAYRRGKGAKRSPLPDFYIGASAAVTG